MPAAIMSGGGTGSVVTTVGPVTKGPGVTTPGYAPLPDIVSAAQALSTTTNQTLLVPTGTVNQYVQTTPSGATSLVQAIKNQPSIVTPLNPTPAVLLNLQNQSPFNNQPLASGWDIRGDAIAVLLGLFL
jgi:hypothetical protein